MPNSRALPPVECCRGTSPTQDANSRPFRKAAPLPMAATIAVATNGPMPGICLSRWQAGSEEAICSTSRFIATICRSRSFHSLHSRLTRLRMRGVRFVSAFSRISGIACFSLKGVLAKTMPRSSRKAPQLVDHGRSARNETSAHTMHGLQVELVIGLDRNEAHVLPVHRLGDGLGIQEVVLVGLHKRLHELGGDQLHVMALFSQNTSEEVSA